MILDAVYQKPEDLTPLLRVCYDVAEEAHGDMVRHKKGGDIPYITHPTIAYKVLQAIGVTDQITLAASFLHDVMEDCEGYKTPEALRAKLEDALYAAGIPDESKVSYLVTELCDELTNAEQMNEGKRGWQYEHGQRLSPRAKLVKVADQAASLIDDILLPSDRSYEQLRKFNMKALECAKACSGANELLDKLFKVVFTDAMVVLDEGKKGDGYSKEMVQSIRDGFSLDYALAMARLYPDVGDNDLPPVRWKRHHNSCAIEKGIVQVGFDDDKKVCRFSMLVDPDRGEESPCNEAIVNLIQRLEAQSKTRVTYQPTGLVNGRVARSFKVKPSLTPEEFIEHAIETGAIEREFSKRITMPPTGRRMG